MDEITMKKHPQYGMELIKPFCLSKMIQQPIIQHHERWNGKGYITKIFYKKDRRYACPFYKCSLFFCYFSG